jgi:hypothetical protein
VKKTVPNNPIPPVSYWEEVGQRRGPNLPHWLLVSGIGAGVMLFVFPVQTSWWFLASTGVVLLAPVVFLLGWMTGMSMFANSCATYRGVGFSKPLVYLVPILLSGTIALGLLGGGYWWLFAIVLAISGNRKGALRAWWTAVVIVAPALRDWEVAPGVRLAETDAEALSQAKDAINEEIGLRPRRNVINSSGS